MASSRRFIDQQKLDYLCNKLQSEGIDVAAFQDFEYRRDENIRYLTGHPMDAQLFLDTSNGETILIPWDFKLAGKEAEATEIINIMEHDRSYNSAIAHVLENTLGKKSNYSIGTISRFPAYSVETLREMGEKIKINSSPLCLEKYMNEIRSTKTPKEIKSLKKSCKLNSSIIPMIEEYIKDNNPTEVDLAVHVEAQMRKLGAEKVAFETLVTNPEHSNEIHCFPSAGKRKLKIKSGLGLIDFGMKYEAMCSDITTPFIFGNISDEQQKMVDAVVETHDLAIDFLKENTGVMTSKVADIANENLLDKLGYKMPHSLGHGLGLATHDPPLFRAKPKNPRDLKNFIEVKLEPGMVVTIEPGVYSESDGGFRLEDDILITENGAEVLTESRVLHFNL